MHRPIATTTACPPASPAVELTIVFVLVGLRLGFWASLAGVATLLTLIPIQVSTYTSVLCVLLL